MAKTMLLRAADNDFNRAWYKNDIGKIYGSFQGFMLMHDICRPTRAEWRAIWRFVRVWGLNIKDTATVSTPVRLGIEVYVSRELAEMRAGMPTDHQERVGQWRAYHNLMNHE